MSMIDAARNYCSIFNLQKTFCCSVNFKLKHILIRLFKAYLLSKEPER